MKKATFFIQCCTCCFFLFHLQSKAEIKSCFTPGSCCESSIATLAKRSKKQILIAVEELTSIPIFTEILNAFHRGVEVYIITDRKKFLENISLAYALNKEGVGVRMSSSTKEHNRFAIFDDTTLATGSYGWTPEDSTTASSSCIITRDGMAVAEHSEHFIKLWNFYTDEIYDFYVEKNYKKQRSFSKLRHKPRKQPKRPSKAPMPHTNL
jgi:hypothetical protein